VLILWAAGVEQGFTSQRWLTYRQAEQAGGHVRRGEKGTVICYADRFTARDEADKARASIARQGQLPSSSASPPSTWTSVKGCLRR